MKEIIVRRKAKGWTQERLAVEVGCTTACISNYENGIRKPDINTAARIATALGCTVDDLIRREESA